MTSSRPYLIRALYDWIVDNGMTPHLLVNTELQGVDVPQEHIHDGRIVLNINPPAVRDLDMSNEFIQFNARFGGVARTIFIPPAAVLAIYARENGQGMAFGEEIDGQPPPSPTGSDAEGKSASSKKPHLKVVK